MSPVATDAYRERIEHWRRQRRERLLAPDGWLSLVGLSWLAPGTQRIGAAADNAIVVPGLPAQLGAVHLNAGGEVTLNVNAAADVRVDGQRVTRTVLAGDDQPRPSMVTVGDVTFYVIRRGGLVGLRMRSPQAGTRRGFGAIDRFPLDASWCVDAAWLPAAAGETLVFDTVVGTTEEHVLARRAVFERDGQRHELLPVLESPDDGHHFLVFADATTGNETCATARFLHTGAVHDGRIELDFNKAINPPSAFSPWGTCPKAPPCNRVSVPVAAGEKAYFGSPAATERADAATV